MSKIKELYAGCDKQQLLHAREEINELIQQKNDEEKRLVWRVLDKWLCVGNFAEDEYLKAVECLVQRANELMDEKNANPNMTRQEMHLEIVSQLVPESEYSDYVSD